MSQNQNQDYTFKYQINSGLVNLVNYEKRKQLIEEGSLVGLNLYSPDKDASIVTLINQSRQFITPEELNDFVNGPFPPIQPTQPTASVPEPPTNLLATPGNTFALISFTAGSDGGSPITNYEYSTNAGVNYIPLNPSDSTSPVTITSLSTDGVTPLTNGTTYMIRLKAVNAIGQSIGSSPVSVTPSTLPSPPTGLSGTAGDREATIYFTAGSDGGSPITNYQYSTDNGSTFRAFSPVDTISPVTITTLSTDGTTPLTNGTPYTIRLKAVNANGQSSASGSVSVTPSTIPNPPTGLSGTPRNRQVLINFTAGSDGGRTITNYQYSTDNGTTFRAFSPAITTSPVTITTFSTDGSTRLLNDVSYSIKLKAVNANGTSSESVSVPVTPILQSGNAVWSTRIAPDNGGTQSANVKTDLYGNTYITGIYGFDNLTINSYSNINAMDIELSTYGTLQGAFNIDTLLAKYDSNGQAQWATKIGGNGDNDFPYIATDSNGNVFITGSYTQTAEFNSFLNVTDGSINVSPFGSLPGNNNYDIFLANYNSNGQAQWATRIHGGNIDISDSIDCDTFGNVYVSGNYRSGTITFTSYLAVTGGNIDLSDFGFMNNSGGRDIFFAKYNSSGAAQWVTRIDGTSDDRNSSVATDPDGNVYIAGTYNSMLTINSFSNVTDGNIELSSYGSLSNLSNYNSIFLAKYNSSGQAQWVTRIDGVDINSTSPLQIKTDLNGNIYIVGKTITPVIFNSFSNISGSDILVSTYGTLENASLFLAKYNSDGIAQWATRLSASTTAQNPDLTIDSIGNVYVAGHYEGTLTANNFSNVDSGIIQTSTYGSIAGVRFLDIFLAKYNPTGQVQWVTRIAGNNDDYNVSISADTNGFVYISGEYLNRAITLNDFINVSDGSISLSPYANMTPTGYPNLFLAKYKQ